MMPTIGPVYVDATEGDEARRDTSEELHGRLGLLLGVSNRIKHHIRGNLAKCITVIRQVLAIADDVCDRLWEIGDRLATVKDDNIVAEVMQLCDDVLADKARTTASHMHCRRLRLRNSSSLRIRSSRFLHACTTRESIGNMST